nr:nickel-dependent lactate racemase [Natranaerobius trueperi]
MVNRLVVETELLISEGFIEPHFFAGFSVGRKSVLPGVAGKKTVLANHCSKFIADPNARTGKLVNNPIHKDMVFASQQAKLSFILNVVIDENEQIINAFAGHPQTAHETGCEFVTNLAVVEKTPADIVVTSNGGYPLDQNIYQTVKGLTAAEATCRKDGVIIILSACNDGHGGESFYKHMAEAKHPKEVTEKVLKIPSDQTLPDQWEFQILARILEKFEVFIVTDQCDKEMMRICI